MSTLESMQNSLLKNLLIRQETDAATDPLRNLERYVAPVLSQINNDIARQAREDEVKYQRSRDAVADQRYKQSVQYQQERDRYADAVAERVASRANARDQANLLMASERLRIQQQNNEFTQSLAREEFDASQKQKRADKDRSERAQESVIRAGFSTTLHGLQADREFEKLKGKKGSWLNGLLQGQQEFKDDPEQAKYYTAQIEQVRAGLARQQYVPNVDDYIALFNDPKVGNDHLARQVLISDFGSLIANGQISYEEGAPVLESWGVQMSTTMGNGVRLGTAPESPVYYAPMPSEKPRILPGGAPALPDQDNAPLLQFRRLLDETSSLFDQVNGLEIPQGKGLTGSEFERLQAMSTLIAEGVPQKGHLAELTKINGKLRGLMAQFPARLTKQQQFDQNTVLINGQTRVVHTPNSNTGEYTTFNLSESSRPLTPAVTSVPAPAPTSAPTLPLTLSSQLNPIGQPMGGPPAGQGDATTGQSTAKASFLPDGFMGVWRTKNETPGDKSERKEKPPAPTETADTSGPVVRDVKARERISRTSEVDILGEAEAALRDSAKGQGDEWWDEPLSQQEAEVLARLLNYSQSDIYRGMHPKKQDRMTREDWLNAIIKRRSESRDKVNASMDYAI